MDVVFCKASIETLHVWIACLRIFGLGLILGEALTRIREGGDCRWTTLGAWICRIALCAMPRPPAPTLAELFRISRCAAWLPCAWAFDETCLICLALTLGLEVLPWTAAAWDIRVLDCD